MKIILAMTLIIVTVILLPGCGERQLDNLYPTHLTIEPIVKVSKSIKFTERSFKNVFIATPSEISKNQEFDNKIIESSMCYRLKSEFEAYGYVVVDNAKDADLIATIHGSNKYDTHYVPPSTVTLPKYIPGQTYTTNSQYSVYSSGGYSSPASVYGQSTTTTPGQWTTENHNRPGYTAGNYYPSIKIDVVDAKSGEELYVVTATGSSNASDIRIATQVLILRSFSQMPLGAMVDRSAGVIGIRFQIATVDGNSYYPFVYGVQKNSPADNADIKFGDCLLEINEHQMVNTTFSGARREISGDPGTAVKIILVRMGERIEKSLVRKERSVVYEAK